jgi:hypothetical protein
LLRLDRIPMSCAFLKSLCKGFMAKINNIRERGSPIVIDFFPGSPFRMKEEEAVYHKAEIQSLQFWPKPR